MDNSAKQYKILDPDNCAMCGMCLNHCPTYKVNNNESESPRGRISIIHGLNASLLAPTESALKHLNSCTLCLACESACHNHLAMEYCGFGKGKLYVGSWSAWSSYENNKIIRDD